MSVDINDIYADTVEYAKHLEKILKSARIVDDEALRSIRADFIKPATNVAKEWLDK